MRNLLLVTATGFALALMAAPSFSAEATPAADATKAATETKASSSIEDQCAAILADKAGHSEADVKTCEKLK
jgi:hypothetical protein